MSVELLYYQETSDFIDKYLSGLSGSSKKLIIGNWTSVGPSGFPPEYFENISNFKVRSDVDLES
jgi:hypothetical protein